MRKVYFGECCKRKKGSSRNLYSHRLLQTLRVELEGARLCSTYLKEFHLSGREDNGNKSNGIEPVGWKVTA